ncbi:MAG: hypothetical protein AB7V60_04425 [Candidatus Caldatribacteriota bacterium]
MKKLDLPVEEICNLYKNGKTLKAIAEQYCCSIATVHQKIKEAGLSIRGRSAFSPQEKNNIYLRYLNGESPTLIANNLNCSYGAVYRVLKNYGIKLDRKKRWSKDKVQELLFTYKKLGTYEKAGAVYNISKQRVHQILTGYKSPTIGGKTRHGSS